MSHCLSHLVGLLTKSICNIILVCFEPHLSYTFQVDVNPLYVSIGPVHKYPLVSNVLLSIYFACSPEIVESKKLFYFPCSICHIMFSIWAETISPNTLAVNHVHISWFYRYLSAFAKLERIHCGFSYPDFLITGPHVPHTSSWRRPCDALTRENQSQLY